MNKHGFKYHGSCSASPVVATTTWIDNHIVRSTRYVGNFADMVEKEVKIQVFPT
ncbi:MAG: hypothetical protein R2818_00765 [Flavobacteriales bacterium]